MLEPHTTNVGCSVPAAIRQKVMNGEFIELAHLLSKPIPLTDQSIHFTVINGELVLKPKVPNVNIQDIGQWTDAFIVFIYLYTTVHTDCTQWLLKYMQSVRLRANRFGGQGWKSDDEQFRLRKAQDPSKSWEQIDQELWVLFMFYNPTSGQ